MIPSRGALRALALTVATVLAASSTEAQEPEYRIHGIVTDATTQRSIEGAAVRIEGTRHGAVTDREGRFSLVADPPPGVYEMRFSRIGYAGTSRPITLDVGREIDLGTMTLRGDVVELHETVATGIGTPATRARRAPAWAPRR